DAASGITFAGNTNLYASAANTLKTDDNFIIGGATTFGTQTTSQTCGSNCTITQGNVDSYSAVLIDATAASLIVSMPDPTVTTAGKVVYVTAVDGSNDFTLRLNSGGTLVDISMKENTTATLIWNGSDWTAAGASSSTDLQAAYNNTLTSAGGAELVLNAAGGNADGLTIRNNSTTPITGALLEVQTSVGSNLFSVNNNATEYADNGGAESSTFTMWTATPDGGTITRYTTAGNYVATGQASTSVVTAATANQGVRNTLTSTLTPNLKYSVSFAVRGTANFNTLDVVYSRDGTNTSTTSCATGQTVTTGKWSRIICTFTAPSSGITSSNAIFIRQSDATAHTFYVDNLSVNVSADVNHAADGSVDSALGSNWTAFGTLDNLTRDTSVIYDTSGAVNVDTPNNADRGVRNNLSITPSTDTQYLVTFYTRSSNTFNDIRVRYSRDGGTSFVSCTDYNTQSVSTSTWTKITCLFTTDSTTATNADLIIDQPTASDRNFYIDALSVTLNQNTANNVQIGGGNEGGPATLLTLDRSAGAPIAENNDAYLGSMYYDTTTGRIQCYEADGWGACGAAPDNIVNLNPEYAGAVLNGSGVGTMTTDFCSNDTALSVNTSLCSTGEAKNFYKWTSPQATQQTYSIYVTYQLPATFKGFASDDTVQLVGRVDNTTNAAVTYEMFKSTGSAVTQCGTGETDVIAGGGGSADTWYSYGINGNESTGCSFTSSSAGNFVIFKINLKANSNASAYVSTLSFTSTGQ
ncbi:carbohydrate binding domain-containing protein, partial [Candidatus Saccharibacteria bacterium]|nr:carbohydrate binding domain-containing protein [Candidatus Saccharibacteria bacterium]